MNKYRDSRHKGFAMIEAMVAGLVMAFGMLAMVSMQLSLSRGADVAKARTEAVRLAQEKMEELRSFSVLETPAGTTWATTKSWDTLPGGAVSDSVTTNSVFTRTWNVATNPLTTSGVTTPDSMRLATVTVSWIDRGDDPQEVKLTSIISRSNPADAGFLGFPLPQNTNLKRPKNRHINIPIPAVDLGNGKSGYQLTDNLAIVFSNDSGIVIKKCESDSSFTLDANYDLSTCANTNALMVAGYVSRASTSIPWPTGINYGGITSANNADIVCALGNAYDQTTNALLSDYKYYLCIIPISDQTDPPSVWSGTLRLGGIPAATNTDTFFVCRYQYKDTDLSANSRNVQPYTNVDESIDSQNYILRTGNAAASCPATTAAEPHVFVLHQDCRPGNASRATSCPASS